MSEFELITFGRGLNRKKHPTFLDDGQNYEDENFSHEHTGKMECRPERSEYATAMTTASRHGTGTGGVNYIHRYGDYIVAGLDTPCTGGQTDVDEINYRDSDDDSYTFSGYLSTNTRPRSADYNQFTFIVNGVDSKVICQGNMYEWQIDNPSGTPTVVEGAAGNPSGTYNCRVTYLIEFPNGETYETGPSSSMEITVSSKKIRWESIPKCPYEGSGLTIQTKLWRDISGTYYLVDTISNDRTSVYIDNVGDSDLQVTASTTNTYAKVTAEMNDVCAYLQRVFGIKDSSLYWTEAYDPFTMPSGNSIVVSKEDEDLIGIVDWADQLYPVTKDRWYRLQGNTSSTWAIKRTFTDVGVINRHTLAKTKFGILGLWYDGIRLFDGQVSHNITERILGKEFFDGISDKDACYGHYDGRRYYFYYPTSGSTLSECIVIDFTDYPNFVIYEDSFVATAHQFDDISGVRYLGYETSEYQETGTETIATTIQTGDRTFKNPFRRKNLKHLHYEIDTNSVDVTAEIYADGVLAQTLTLNTSSRTKKRSDPLKQIDAYRFSLKLTCADSSSLVIYEPWALEATFVGD